MKRTMRERLKAITDLAARNIAAEERWKEAMNNEYSSEEVRTSNHEEERSEMDRDSGETGTQS